MSQYVQIALFLVLHFLITFSVQWKFGPENEWGVYLEFVLSLVLLFVIAQLIGLTPPILVLLLATFWGGERLGARMWLRAEKKPLKT